MMVYPPDVLSEQEAQDYNRKGKQHWVLDDHDYQILFARRGLIFTGHWETHFRSGRPAFFAEVFPL